MASVAASLEAFKNNMGIMEKTIAEESHDPVPELKLYAGWIDYINRPEATPEQRNFMLKESIPKVVTTLVNRKYDPSYKMSEVLQFLRTVVQLIGSSAQTLETMHSSLKELFDPSRSFYSRNFAPKALVNAQAVAEDVALLPKAFIDGLEIGTYLDIYNADTKLWELASIELFSDYRTEFQIRWANRDTTLWLSIDRDAAKIAPFGTRTDTPEHASTPPMAGGAATTGASTAAGQKPGQPIVVAGTPPSGDIEQHPVIEYTDDASWRQALAQGDMIDALDSSTSSWFQACIMELSYVEVFSRVLSDGSRRAYSVALKTIEMSDCGREEIKAASDTLCATGDDTVPLSLIGTIAPLGLVGKDAADSTASRQVEELASSEDDLIAEGELRAAAAVAAEAPVELVVHTQLFARVAFIGASASADEWIDVYDFTRIQPYNSHSGGRRKDLLSVREEIKFLAYNRTLELSLYKMNRLKAEAEQKNAPGANSITEYSEYYDGLFVEEACADLVESFGFTGGFASVVRYLSDQLKLGTESRNMTCITSIICSIGNMYKVIHKKLLQKFFPHLLKFATQILNSMSQANIRELSVDSIEKVLDSLDHLAVATWGRFPTATAATDELAVTSYLQILTSPFLNRRLGGLKMLSEIMREAEAAESAPSCGVKIVRTVNSEGVEVTSYQVVHVVLGLKLSVICEMVQNSGALIQIFSGGQSHESLMARSSVPLRLMASCNALSSDLLSAIWDAGTIERKSEALRALSDMIPSLDVSALELLLAKVCDVEDSAVTISIVDVTASIASTLRDKLVCHFINFNARGGGGGGGGSSSIEGDDDRGAADSDTVSDGVIPTLLRKLPLAGIYTKALIKLWTWVQDSTDESITESVVSQCLDKLESLLDNRRAVSSSSANSSSSSSSSNSSNNSNEANKHVSMRAVWLIHWQYSSLFAGLALSSIANNTSIMSALKVLQFCVLSWPKVPANKVTTSIGDLPINVPTRYAFVAYFETQNAVINTVTKAITQIKSDFNLEARAKYGSNVTGSLVVVLTAEQQHELYTMKLPRTRNTYKDQLEKCFDFIHMFVRNGEFSSVQVPLSSIYNIWRDVVQKAACLEEVEAVVEFCSRLVYRAQSSSASIENDTAALTTEAASAGEYPPPAASAPAAAAIPATRSNPTAYCARDTIEWVFTNLLCDNITRVRMASDNKGHGAGVNRGGGSGGNNRRGAHGRTPSSDTEGVDGEKNPWSDGDFIQSLFFTQKAFACLEKWFRWINVDKGNIVENASTASGSGSKDTGFTVVVDPSTLVGIDVFQELILCCRYEQVAKSAVNLITSLPRFVSSTMTYREVRGTAADSDTQQHTLPVEKGALSAFRSSLINRSLSELQTLYAKLQKQEAYKNLNANNSSINNSNGSSSSINRSGSRRSSRSDGGEIDHQQQQIKPSRLSRSLLLIEGVLKESNAMSVAGWSGTTTPSSSSAVPNVSPHGSLRRDVAISFKMQCTSKTLKSYSGQVITMRTSQTVSDLFQLISSTVRCDVHNLKVFRSGKELMNGAGGAATKSTALKGSTKLALLPNLSESGIENIVIAEKPKSNVNTSGSGSSSGSESVPDTAAASATDTSATRPEPSTVSEEHSQTEDTSDGTGTDALPAVTLSSTKTHMDLLMNVLQLSTGRECDDMWKLLMSLPTAASLLRKWVNLDCAHVRELLVEPKADTSERSSSSTTSRKFSYVSTLLYNLQTVSMLLQPADNYQELADSSNFEGCGVDYGMLLSWPRRFIDKGGFSALCDALRVTTFALTNCTTSLRVAASNNNNNNNNNHNPVTSSNNCNNSNSTNRTSGYSDGYVAPSGVTLRMLKECIALAAKLVRAFVVRIAFTDKLQEMVHFLDTVVTVVASVEDVSEKTSEKNDAKVSAVTIVEERSKESTDKDSKNAAAVLEGWQLSKEWGWQLTQLLANRSINAQLTADINFSMLHKHTLTSMMMVKELFVGLTEDSKGEVVDHSAALHLLNDLLTLWGSVIVIQPSVIVNISHFEVHNGKLLALSAGATAEPSPRAALCALSSSRSPNQNGYHEPHQHQRNKYHMEMGMGRKITNGDDYDTEINTVEQDSRSIVSSLLLSIGYSDTVLTSSSRSTTTSSSSVTDGFSARHAAIVFLHSSVATWFKRALLNLIPWVASLNAQVPRDVLDRQFQLAIPVNVTALTPSSSTKTGEVIDFSESNDTGVVAEEKASHPASDSNNVNISYWLSCQMLLSLLDLRPCLVSPSSYSIISVSSIKSAELVRSHSIADLDAVSRSSSAPGFSSSAGINDGSSHVDVSMQHRINTTYDPLFDLTALLLSERDAIQYIPVQTKYNTCIRIVEELHEAAYTAQKQLSMGRQCKFFYLEGVLKLLAELCVDSNKNLLLGKKSSRNVLEFLLTECLGILPAEQCGRSILCVEHGMKKAAYKVIDRLCSCSSSLAVRTYKAFVVAHNSLCDLGGDVNVNKGSATAVSSSSGGSTNVWGVKPEQDSRSSTGYVGLRNLGSTCYMNSLLQVLYMQPQIRTAILAAPEPACSSIEQCKDDLLFQLKQMFYYLQHSEKKAYNPTNWTYAYKDESGTKPINVGQQQDAQEFLQVLCERIEANVSARNREYVAKTTHVGMQLPDNDRGGTEKLTSAVQDMFKASLGGKICNQMYKSSTGGNFTAAAVSSSSSSSSSVSPPNTAVGGISSDTAPNSSNAEVREQEEGFVCISVDVKNCKGLEESLGKFVEGEQISDYQWNDNEPRENITKRQCISALPDTLVFHLKRFELNFDTFRREKVNDHFSFPLELNMRPYTKEGLMSPSVDDDDNNDDGSREYELSAVVVHTGTADSGHYFSYIKEQTTSPPAAAAAAATNPTTPSASGTTTPGVSTGRKSAPTSARSGTPPLIPPASGNDRSTYPAVAVDSSSSSTSCTNSADTTNRWFEFNDSIVSPFALSRLEEQCFGGSTQSHEYFPSTGGMVSMDVPNPQSAYMIVYNRRIHSRLPQQSLLQQHRQQQQQQQQQQHMSPGASAAIAALSTPDSHGGGNFVGSMMEDDASSLVSGDSGKNLRWPSAAPPSCDAATAASLGGDGLNSSSTSSQNRIITAAAVSSNTSGKHKRIKSVSNASFRYLPTGSTADGIDGRGGGTDHSSGYPPGVASSTGGFPNTNNNGAAFSSSSFTYSSPVPSSSSLMYAISSYVQHSNCQHALLCRVFTEQHLSSFLRLVNYTRYNRGGGSRKNNNENNDGTGTSSSVFSGVMPHSVIFNTFMFLFRHVTRSAEYSSISQYVRDLRLFLDEHTTLTAAGMGSACFLESELLGTVGHEDHDDDDDDYGTMERFELTPRSLAELPVSLKQQHHQQQQQQQDLTVITESTQQYVMPPSPPASTRATQSKAVDNETGDNWGMDSSIIMDFDGSGSGSGSGAADEWGMDSSTIDVGDGPSDTDGGMVLSPKNGGGRTQALLQAFQSMSDDGKEDRAGKASCSSSNNGGMAAGGGRGSGDSQMGLELASTDSAEGFGMDSSTIDIGDGETPSGERGGFEPDYRYSSPIMVDPDSASSTSLRNVPRLALPTGGSVAAHSVLHKSSLRPVQHTQNHNNHHPAHKKHKGIDQDDTEMSSSANLSSTHGENRTSGATTVVKLGCSSPTAKANKSDDLTTKSILSADNSTEGQARRHPDILGRNRSGSHRSAVSVSASLTTPAPDVQVPRQPDISASVLITEELLQSFDSRVMDVLYCPKQEVRSEFASLLVHTLNCIARQDIAAGNASLLGHSALTRDLLIANTMPVNATQALVAATTATGASTTTATPPLHNNGSNGGGSSSNSGGVITATIASNVATAGVVTAVDAADVADEEDPDLALAIMMSQGGGSGIGEGGVGVVTAIPVSAVAVLTTTESKENIVPPVEGHNTTVTTAPPPTDVNTRAGPGSTSSLSPPSSGVFEKYSASVVRVLLQLTTDDNLTKLASQWRNNSAAQRVLFDLVQNLGSNSKGDPTKVMQFRADLFELFARRNVVCSGVDAFLGEQSPLCGSLYPQNARKRAPSSYVPLGVQKVGATLPSNARNIPDWTYLLDTIAIIVSNSRNMYLDSLLLSSRGDYVVGAVELSAILSMPSLDEWDVQCITCKTLYSTLFKQARYCSHHVIKMISHLSFQNKEFSDMIIECIFEEFNFATHDGLFHLFNVLESFLSIDDSLRIHRVHILLSMGGHQNLLSMASKWADSPPKQKYVCVFIRSFTALIMKVHMNMLTINSQQQQHQKQGFAARSTLLDMLDPKNMQMQQQQMQQQMQPGAYNVAGANNNFYGAVLDPWAPWMLRFCYRYVNSLGAAPRTSANSSTTSAINASVDPSSSPSTSASPALTERSESVCLTTVPAVPAVGGTIEGAAPLTSSSVPTSDSVNDSVTSSTKTAAAAVVVDKDKFKSTFATIAAALKKGGAAAGAAANKAKQAITKDKTGKGGNKGGSSADEVGGNCKGTADTLSSGGSSSSVGAEETVGGSFLAVYGEVEPERELNWPARAQRTRSALEELLRSAYGVQEPMSMLPADTFDAPSSSSSSSATAAAAGGGGTSISSSGVGVAAGAADSHSSQADLDAQFAAGAMTDEQFAQFLQNQENDPSGVHMLD